jgi:hypothetical protein
MVQIEYVSQRKEVWDWYWHAWRRGLWKTHALMLVVIFTVSVAYGSGHFNFITEVTRCVLSAFTIVVLSAVFPQIMFKPRMRTISLDGDGLHTTIGSKSGMRSWRDVRSINEWRGHIVITSKSGNAFIVPPRAFADHCAYVAFLSFAKASCGPGEPLAD